MKKCFSCGGKASSVRERTRGKRRRGRSDDCEFWDIVSDGVHLNVINATIHYPDTPLSEQNTEFALLQPFDYLWRQISSETTDEVPRLVQGFNASLPHLLSPALLPCLPICFDSVCLFCSIYCPQKICFVFMAVGARVLFPMNNQDDENREWERGRWEAAAVVIIRSSRTLSIMTCWPDNVLSIKIWRPEACPWLKKGRRRTADDQLTVIE